MTTKPRRRSAITALFAAAIVFLLALPAFASAEPAGEMTVFGGLRGTAFVKEINAGPDGNVWFVDNRLFSANIPAIGKITPSGTITEYISGTNLSGLNEGSNLVSITAAPGGDKHLWFTDKGLTPAIGVIDSASPETAVEYSAGLNAGSAPEDIVAGPDGNLWFTDAGTTPAIGMINPSTHEIKEFSTGLEAESAPRGIVAGPDGNLWFTDAGTTRAIGKINPSTHEIKEFPTGEGSEPGGGTQDSGGWGIAAGTDGNVWFTENGINESNAPNGKAIGRITPSGTIAYFSTGLLASSKPSGLTAAPGGKLWFTDNDGLNEEQELKIEDAGSLGGTYKLGFEGQETGATGTGNVMHTAKGTGEVKRFTAATNKCAQTSGSNKLACTVSVSAAEVGMRIERTGIPLETTIESVEVTGGSSGNIYMTKTPTSTTSSGEVKAGRVKNLTVSEGTFEVGMPLTGTGIASGTIILAVGEEGGKVTLVPSKAPTAAGASVTVEGNAVKTALTNVTTSTGAFSKGETISGTGITAGTTITAVNTTQKTLTLSAAATAGGTGVSLSADLGFDAEGQAIAEALTKLSTAPVGSEVVGAGENVTSPIIRTFLFEGALGSSDIEQLTCNGAGLTGTSPSCTVTTTAAGLPNAIDSITASGTIERYPNNKLNFGGYGITNEPGGKGENVWFSTGFRSSQKIGKFGIEEETGLPLKVTHEGTGGGTIQSSPAGITCTSGSCEHNYAEGEAVTLTASPAAGSAFVAWKNCDAGGVHGRQCTVHVTPGHKTVGAKFEPANTVTVKTKGTGTGSVSGVTCGNTCTEASGIFLASKAVTLKAKPYAKNSEFAGWSASPVSCTLSEEGKTCSLGTLGANETVEAEFKEIARETLTVTKSGNGQGSVKSSPAGINCAYTCGVNAAYFYKGATVTLTASIQAGKGSELGNWGGGTCSGTEATPCVVTMSAAKSVTAEFK